MTDLLVICETTEEMRAQMGAHFDATHWKDVPNHSAWLKANGELVQYVLTDGHLGVPQDILEALPNLSAISSYGVGYDAIDTAATTARGIPVSHTPGVLDAEVSTSALMLFMACWRNLEAEMSHARSGSWAKQGGLPLAHSVDGQTVGILGLGRIGKALATKLEAFGVTVLYHGRSKQDVRYKYYDDLLAMARECDTLISVAPGGAATHHLIDKPIMDALGPDGCLINVGRGSVVDEAALITALESGRLGRAGLDVFEAEPLIPDALRALPNVVLTPHIGSATVETRRAMGDLAVRNLISFKSGQGLLTPVPESRDLLGLN